jgi:hypothetical protein
MEGKKMGAIGAIAMERCSGPVRNPSFHFLPSMFLPSFAQHKNVRVGFGLVMLRLIGRSGDRWWKK